MQWFPLLGWLLLELQNQINPRDSWIYLNVCNTIALGADPKFHCEGETADVAESGEKGGDLLYVKVLQKQDQGASVLGSFLQVFLSLLS
jgi:hypothetical protein